MWGLAADFRFLPGGLNERGMLGALPGECRKASQEWNLEMARNRFRAQGAEVEIFAEGGAEKSDEQAQRQTPDCEEGLFRPYRRRGVKRSLQEAEVIPLPLLIGINGDLEIV